MAHAAGLGRARPEHLDTTQPGGVVAHPLFPVAPEWALLTGEDSALDLGLGKEESGRGVHAAHELVLHRPIDAGAGIELVAVVSGLERSRAGTRMTIDFSAVDRAGAALWDTRMTSVHLGVDLEGPDASPPLFGERRPVGPVKVVEVVEVSIGAGDAHVYSECARIWNPIHTDPAAARAVGLPGTILHGTATLAHGVSAVMDVHGAAATEVVGVQGGLRAMVGLPSTLRVEVGRAKVGVTGLRLVGFTVLNAAGEPAVHGGEVVLHPR